MTAVPDAMAAPAEEPRNVFVMSLDEFNHGQLTSMLGADRYRFHPLLTYDEVGRESEHGVDVVALLDRCRDQLASFEGSVDAIISYWDFPISEMAAILAAENGLPGPSVESVVKASHKYWSRVEQRECIPENIPDFRALDIYDDQAVADLDLPFPFWLKPVRGYSSHLGFRIGNRRDLQFAVDEIRANLSRLGGPLEVLLDQPGVPTELAEVGGNYCVAESLVGGQLATIEGWAHQGEVHVYGVVDSIREANRSSFSRYQYPSSLPKVVRNKMIEVGTRFVEHIGYDNAAFNIELFWDRRSGKVKLLEMNTRCSQSHAELFRQVDGSPNLQIAVQLGLGERPTMPKGAGCFNYAAKFFIRHDRDAVVQRVPSDDDLRAVQERHPAATVLVEVDEGTRLSELVDQDSYSYELGVILLAGRNKPDLLRQHRSIVATLPFELEPAV